MRQKKVRTGIITRLIVLSGMLWSLTVGAQAPAQLGIGDAAPPLRYSKWIKGAPVEAFDGRQLYILEFWATWCGPCKAAMPGLTRLAKEYAGKASFIGVNVWERPKKEDGPYESTLPEVERFVKGNSENMGYNVIADNNATDMVNYWLKPAGINGIPSTFVIKDGKIIWIGHPVKLDSLMPLFLNGKYDMEAYKAVYAKQKEAGNKQTEMFTRVLTPVTEAIKNKDYRKALDLIDKGLEEKIPLLDFSLKSSKLTALLQLDEPKALQLGEEWLKTEPNGASLVAMTILRTEGLSEPAYLLGAKALETMAGPGAQQDINPMLYSSLANLYAKGGDLNRAVSNQEKAIEAAKVALKEKKFIGTIMDYTITDMENELKNYRSSARLEPFEISGMLKGATPTGYVYISYSTGERQYVSDSALVRDGRFSFSGALPHPVSASIMAEQYRQWTGKEDAGTLYIEPGKMQLTLVKGDFRSAKLTGSASQQEYESLVALNKAPEEKMKGLSAAYNKANEEYINARKAGKDEATLDKLKEKATEAKDKMDPYSEEIRKNTVSWMKAHPGSWVTAATMRYYAGMLKLHESEDIYARMPPVIQQSDYGKALAKEIEMMRMGSPGSTAHDFSKKDINGRELRLSDYKGKYVLIDFWASWCVPCRKGNPHLLSLYSKYKDKGLEIIGVSDDDSNPDAWRKAVEKDGIGAWKHVLRGLDMKKKMAGEPNPDDLSDYYGIHSLPTKILIDPEGVIVGRYGGGGENDEAMDKKMKEAFGF